MQSVQGAQVLWLQNKPALPRCTDSQDEYLC